MSCDDLLRIEGLCAGYGNREVVSGVRLRVGFGQIAAVIGHNGVGKSTLFKAIYGLIPTWSGSISVGGTPTPKPSPRLMRDLGVAYVPQGNRVFGSLSVRENLQVSWSGERKFRFMEEQLDSVLSILPQLKPRLHQRAATLSGGERQMLALASALLASPRLFLLDEPSLGLDPGAAERVFARIRQLNHDLGVAFLVIEQKVRRVLDLANTVYVLKNGLVAYSGPSDDLRDEAKLREVYL